MIKIAVQYLFYKLFAPHRKGFGVHSPFVFNLVTEVLVKQDNKDLAEIQEWRKGLLKDRTAIETNGSGAGSLTHHSLRRKVAKIAGRSSVRHKYGRVLYYLKNVYKPSAIIELGTGIGISTAYLAKSTPGTRVITVENDQQKIIYAAKEYSRLNLDNIVIRDGIFSKLLPGLLQEVNHPLMIFIDGDHSYESTMEYFSMIRKVAREDTLIIFDDIRWSDGMKEAWDKIRADESVTVSIDIFFMGIVFFRGGITKQDFIVNF